MAKRTRYNTLPTCRHGHLLVPDNLIKHGAVRVCRTCNVKACQRWLARKRTRDVLRALGEASYGV